MKLQDTLLEYDIDPIIGFENIVYAPNLGHPIINDEQVARAIKKVVINASQDKQTKEQTRQAILFELKKQAERFIIERWPEYKKFALYL